MSARLGTGKWTYEELPDWPQLPDGLDLLEVPDLVVGPGDRVYVFSRGAHPVVVFDADGTFVTTWGEGAFTRPHGLTLGPDGHLYCADDSGHCIRQYTLDGRLLMTLGTPGQPAPRHGGRPFHQPTRVAVHPATGDLFVSDGYGNARVHRYSSGGDLLLSWGEYGTGPGQFNLVHSICADRQGRLYVADRENHRVQVFDGEGTCLGQWNNLHRPCGLHVEGQVAYVGQLPTHLAVNADYPNIGACVTVCDLQGQCLARLGDVCVGEGPGQFTAPHGLAVDSRGDLYVGEVSWSAYGRRLDPPRTARCLRKLVRVG